MSADEILATVTDVALEDAAGTELVRGVSMTIARGRTLALVGESGSGKTLTVKALAGLLSAGVRQVRGRVRFDGSDVPPGPFPQEIRDRIGYVFQDPMVALNPLQTVFDQVADAVDPRRELRSSERNERTWHLLGQVSLRDLDETARKLPGELSGGMCQRVVIAMAIARQPSVLIADEPTTALDVTVQAQILDLLESLRNDLGAALVLVSHDLGVVAERADEVMVFRDGLVVEQGPTARVIRDSQHEYTRSLGRATPTLSTARPNEELLSSYEEDHHGQAVIVEGRNLHLTFGRSRRAQGVVGLEGVSVRAREGEAVGIVGESGSGKSTLLRVLAGLERAGSGHVLFCGEDAWSGRVRASQRSAIQVVFQDSWGSLDPYLSVSESIEEPLRVHAIGSRIERQRIIGGLLDEVGLTASQSRRRPHELSGGQRQRAGIARALSLNPRVLLADEPVSALDVSIQAQIIGLLARLQRERQMTMLVVSHDLAVIRLLTSYLYVMSAGRVVEEGATSAVIEDPQDDFTQRLVASIPGY